ncbi:MAG: acetate--CoA ligase family protein [Anaerolineaceae bacterium]|nr:acetate--CoA ligase family protein [Anaerolineaceae bacterium]
MIARSLDFFETRDFLQPYGIPFPRQTLVNPKEQVRDAASEIGYPLVLKLISPQATHKSDQHLVVLDIQDEDELLQHIKRLSEITQGWQVHGYLLQQQISGGIEVLMGTTLDEQFGHTLIFGSGGKLVEWMDDTVIRIPPLNRWQIEEMIQESRISDILKGYRDIPACNVAHLIDLLQALNHIVVDQANRLLSIDLNPVIVLPEGVYAVDARIFVKEEPR